jgi:hypothetical protein
MKPSRSNRAGWEPLTCYLCGGRIYMDGPKARGAMFSYRNGKPRSRHADCHRKMRP